MSDDLDDDQLDAMAERLRAERQSAAGAERWGALAPARFHAAHLDGLAGKGAQPITEWAFGPEGRNLIITGPVGTGKTWAALAAVRAAVEAGTDVRFWPVVELLDALRPGGDDHALEAAMRCELLVLDDVGAERPTDWVAERMYAIVNRRWMDARPIVATTNHANGDELAAHVGERMRSRLVGSGAVVVRLTGNDRRRDPTPTPRNT